MKLPAVPVIMLAATACGGAKPPPKVVEASPPPHPTRVQIEDDSQENEDGVTFVNKHGHMAEGAIDDGIAPHTDAMSQCFTTKVGRRRYLGGQVQLHWDIDADGTVSSVKLAESDLGAWDIEQCLVDEASDAEFAKPIGGPTDFSLPLAFAMKGSAAVWDEDKTLAAVGGQLALLDECAAPKPAPKQPGAKQPSKKNPPEETIGRLHAERNKLPAPTNVTITFYVGPHGKVQSVGFSSPTSGISDRWAECAQKTVTAWRLPDPQGQMAKLAIRYKPE